jgi:SAM-dependent methyltransferase
VSDKFDLYNHAYRGHESEVYRQIRLATYGRDFGQTSWVTTEESDAIPRFLQISASSEVLEIGFGSGLYAIHLAKTTGCRITGVEINTHAVATATELARQSSLEALVTFQRHDVSERLPFESNRFHAAFSNDVLCHVPDRLFLLQELHRVLRPGGQLLFSDALVIGGLVTNEELAIRSSIGLYVFAAPGENEKLLEEAGFDVAAVMDTTSNAASIAERWRAAREAHTARLIEIEGEANYEGLQRFLNCVSRLTRENRLLRYLYRAAKRD